MALALAGRAALRSGAGRWGGVASESLFRPAWKYSQLVATVRPSNATGITVRDDLTGIFPDGASWSCAAIPSGTLTFEHSVLDETTLGADTIDLLAGAAAVAATSAAHKAAA